MADLSPFHAVVPLPRDDLGDDPVDVTANDAFHWVPLHDNGLRERMATITEWVSSARPQAMVIDVSVEVTTLVRLLGIPVVVVAMPGERTDAAHTLAYRIADHIIAPWPAEAGEPGWLQPYRHKTTYVGGITRFDGRTRTTGRAARTQVLAMFGAGGSTVDGAAIAQGRAAVPDAKWDVLGGSGDSWADDPWDTLCAADVVVAHAGQGSIADIAAARTPAILIPQERPFGEQAATAKVLARQNLAVVRTQWPQPSEWPALIDEATRIEPQNWRRWRTEGAAGRAASVIERVARRRSTDGACP